MKIILLGAPGAGKGTQAVRISEKFNIAHVSTGDIFRANIKNQTPIGVIAKSYIDKGQLVPDEVTVEIVKQRLAESDVQNGYILDGFPRNIFQAEELDKFTQIDKVIDISVDETKLLRRITGRRVCSKCGDSYHVDRLNGATTCARCGGDLITRADDNEETVKSRLQVYRKQTEPLIEYYQSKGKLVTINGDSSIEDAFAEIVNALKQNDLR